MVRRFILIKETIGWIPFQDVFRFFNALPEGSIPSTKIAKLELFLDKLSNFSGTVVRDLIPQTEYDWIISKL